MAQNVSEQLVEMMVNAGVRRIYAVTGDSLNPVNEAIRKDEFLSGSIYGFHDGRAWE